MKHRVWPTNSTCGLNVRMKLLDQTNESIDRSIDRFKQTELLDHHQMHRTITPFSDRLLLHYQNVCKFDTKHKTTKTVFTADIERHQLLVKLNNRGNRLERAPRKHQNNSHSHVHQCFKDDKS